VSGRGAGGLGGRSGVGLVVGRVQGWSLGESGELSICVSCGFCVGLVGVWGAFFSRGWPCFSVGSTTPLVLRYFIAKIKFAIKYLKWYSFVVVIVCRFGGT